MANLCICNTIEESIQETENAQSQKEDNIKDINTGNNSSWGTSSSEYSGDWSYRERKGKVCSKTWDNEFKRAGKALGIDWVLVAAHSSIESGWNEKIKSSSTSAGGLYQFIAAYWHGDAPKGYSDPKYRFDGKIATDAYIHRITRSLNKFKNAVSRNDQILLSFQSFHDGTIGGTSWKNVKGNKYTYTKEGRNYIPKLMKRYKELGGSV